MEIFMVTYRLFLSPPPKHFVPFDIVFLYINYRV